MTGCDHETSDRAQKHPIKITKIRPAVFHLIKRFSIRPVDFLVFSLFLSPEQAQNIFGAFRDRLRMQTGSERSFAESQAF